MPNDLEYRGTNPNILCEIIEKVEKSFNISQKSPLWLDKAKGSVGGPSYISITIDPFCLSQING
ncbi:MAG: hypothetical protein DRO95_04495 [Candidatus Altiarchaeales archaeon]|nr:MAG: hypothetical protein DRO95_04495 [Candidatus Altiarchaeales archaeon]